MGKPKKASVPASILIESLVALGFCCRDYDLIVREIRRSRKERLADFKEVEVLSVAQMALKTRAKKSSWRPMVFRFKSKKMADQLTVYHQGKLVLHVE